MSKIFVISDVPPIRDQAPANHSVAWSLCSALQRGIGVLATRKFTKHYSKRDYSLGLSCPVWVYRDGWRLGLRKLSEDLRGILDVFLWLTELPKAARKYRESSCDRILAIGSNHWSCLIPALLLSKAVNAPVEVFLMDDLEASAQMRGRKVHALVARFVEGGILAKFDTVWTISEGYGEHLRKKYGEEVKTKFLPLPIRKDRIEYAPHQEEKKVLGFSGSTHGLYHEPLKFLVKELSRLNKEAGRQEWGMRFFLAGEKLDLREELGDQDGIIETVVGLSNDDLVEGLRKSYANYLPYSFGDEYKLMVSTAFSCKSAEFLLVGRPILVFGPNYASVPKHFAKEGLPLVISEPDRLIEGLKAIAQNDGPQLIGKYQEMLTKFHSPAAIRSRIDKNRSGKT